jgi:hypothetical protein
VERKFATLYGRVQTMVNAAKVTKLLCEGIWAEAAKTANDIENMIVNPNKPVAAMIYGIHEPKLKILCTLREMAAVENHDQRKI